MAESSVFRKVIGKMIARERKKRGLSQQDLAIKMEKNENYISKIENGRVNITFDYLELITVNLQCEIEDFLNTDKHIEILLQRIESN